MDKHQDDKQLRRMGELGIVKAIGEAERQSVLWSDPRYNARTGMDFRELENTWLKKFFRRMQRNIRKGEVESLFQRVTFIIFNYDRCVEHFLLSAIQQSYGTDEREAALIIKNAEIIHPYGTIGYLPWQVATPGVRVAFGSERLPILEMADGIRTYADRVDDEATLNRIHNAVANAELICFLGFSYLDQNLDLITPPGSIRTAQVLGTSLNISEYNRKIIADDLHQRFETPSPNQVVLEGSTCAKLIENFERAFS